MANSKLGRLLGVACNIQGQQEETGKFMANAMLLSVLSGSLTTLQTDS